MIDSIVEQLLCAKDQLIRWPEGEYFDQEGTLIDPDKAFILIESQLQELLNKILALPESEKSRLKDVIDDFKVAIEKRYQEAECNLQEIRNKIAITRGAAKAMKAYGQAIKVEEQKNESNS